LLEIKGFAIFGKSVIVLFNKSMLNRYSTF